MNTESTARRRKSGRLRKAVATALSIAIVGGGVVGTAQSASAAPSVPTWDSPWLAGAPVYPGDEAVVLDSGLRVNSDHNSWVLHSERSWNGAISDVQTTPDSEHLFAIMRGVNGESGAVATKTGGADWVPIGPPTTGGTWDISASTDGGVVALAAPGTDGGLLISGDGGGAFAQPTAVPSSYEWTAVAVSGDGATVVAAGQTPDGSEAALWVSKDGGASWNQTTVSAGNPGVSETKRSNILTSSTGDAIAVFASTKGSEVTPTGTVEVSTDDGESWESRATPAGAAFDDAAMNGDGSKVVITRGITYRSDRVLGIVAVHASDEGTFTSEDLGVTWTEALATDGKSLGYPGVAAPVNGVVQVTKNQPASAVSGWFVVGNEPAVSPNGAVIWTAPTASTSSEVRGNALIRTKLTRSQTTSQLAPRIDSLSPSTGTTKGGTEVVVTGGGFDSCMVVTIAGVEQTTVFGDSGHLSFVTPPAIRGGVNVGVISTCGSQDSNTVEYVYAEHVVSLDPASGPTAGGTSVTIHEFEDDYDFDSCSVVTVDGLQQPTELVPGVGGGRAVLRFVTQAHGSGEVSVVVSKICGTGIDSNPVTFTFVAPETPEATEPPVVVDPPLVIEPPVTVVPPVEEPTVEPPVTVVPPVEEPTVEPPVTVVPPVEEPGKDVDTPSAVDMPVVTNPPVITPPAVVDTTEVATPATITQPTVRPFEAQTSAEGTGSPLGALGLALALAGVLALGFAGSRRKGAAS